MSIASLLVLTGLTANAAENEPVRIAVLAEQSASQAAVMLESVLADSGKIQLLNRTDIAAVLAEQKLELSRATEGDMSRVGRIVKADGLIFLRTETIDRHRKLAVRVVAVGPGIVLAESHYAMTLPPGVRQPPGEEPLILQTARQIALEVDRLLPKFRVPSEDAVALSVAGLFSQIDRPETRMRERQLTRLLIHRLTHEPSLFVLERRYLDRLIRENLLAGEAEPFRTGRAILLGSLEPVPEKPLGVTLKLELRPPGDAEPVPIELTGSAADLPALADQTARAVLEALRRTPAQNRWDHRQEAKYYAEQTRWALSHGLLESAQAAAESALALGHDDHLLIEQLVRAYCLVGYPSFAGTRDGSYQNGYFPAKAKIRDPRTLPSLIRAMELVIGYLHVYPRPTQEFPEIGDRGEPNIDYRVLSTRAMFSASRVLRAFWELRATPGHEAELAELRALLREAGRLLRTGEIHDSRDAWVYYLTGVYTPFWVERPEDALPLYREVIRVEAGPEEHTYSHDWGRYRVMHAFSHRDRSPNGPRRSVRTRRYHAPWIMAWNEEDEPRIDALWADFLEELDGSRRPADRGAAWAFRFMPLLRNDSKEAKPDLEGLLAFLWKEREQVAQGLLGPWVFELFRQSVRKADPAYRARFFRYLMQHGTFVDPLYLSSLRSSGEKGWNKADLALTLDEQRDLWQEYAARLKRHPRQAIVKEYFRQVNYLGWLKEVQVARKPKPQPEPPNTSPAPAPAPSAPPPAVKIAELNVNRYWLAELRPELRELQKEDARLSVSVGHLQFANDRLWFSNSVGSQLLNVDPHTLQTSFIPVPRTSRFSSNIYDLVVTPRAIFAARWNTPTSDALINRYDIESGKWSALDVPRSHYSLTWLEPYLYITFGRDPQNPQRRPANSLGAGIYRLDPRTGKMTLLAASRRRPAQSKLDDCEAYWPLNIFQGPDGQPHAILLQPDGTQAIYGWDEKQADWQEAGHIGRSWIKQREEREWFYSEPDQDGGLLLWDRHAYSPTRIHQYVYLGPRSKSLGKVLLANEKSVRERKLWPGEPQWQLDESFHRRQGTAWHARGVYDGKRLTMLVRSATSNELRLQVWEPHRAAPLVVRLHFHLPEAAIPILKQKRARLDRIRYPPASSLIFTPRQMVIEPNDGHGFWVIPRREVDAALETARELSVNSAQ